MQSVPAPRDKAAVGGRRRPAWIPTVAAFVTIARVEEGNIVFNVDGAEINVASDNIEKAKLVPDWVALGLAPAIDKSGRDARPGKQKKPTKKPAARPSSAE